MRSVLKTRVLVGLFSIPGHINKSILLNSQFEIGALDFEVRVFVTQKPFWKSERQISEAFKKGPKKGDQKAAPRSLLSQNGGPRPAEAPQKESERPCDSSKTRIDRAIIQKHHSPCFLIWLVKGRFSLDLGHEDACLSEGAYVSCETARL